MRVSVSLYLDTHSFAIADEILYSITWYPWMTNMEIKNNLAGVSI